MINHVFVDFYHILTSLTFILFCFENLCFHCLLLTLLCSHLFCVHTFSVFPNFTSTRSSSNQKHWKSLQNTVAAANILKQRKFNDRPHTAEESGDRQNGTDALLAVDGPSCQYFPHKASLTSQHMLPLPALKE